MAELAVNSHVTLELVPFSCEFLKVGAFGGNIAVIQ